MPSPSYVPVIKSATSGNFSVGGNSAVAGNETVGGNQTVSGYLAAAHALGMPLPQDSGYQAWTFDPAAIAVNSSLPLGIVFMYSIWISTPANLTQIYWANNSAQGTLVAGQCWTGLYDGNGNQLCQVDISAGPLAAGLSQITIPTTAVTPGRYYVGFLANTSAGTYSICAGVASSNVKAAMNGGLTGNYRFGAVQGVGQTVLPASFTPSALNTTNVPSWIAVG